jgi:hypothetical protein
MSKRPTYEQLRSMDVRRSMNRHRPDLEKRATRFGIKFTDKTDVFDLAGKVHRAEDEAKRPVLEARARALGVWTHWGWPFKVKRNYTNLSLAVYKAEDYAKLLKKWGE